MPYSVKGFFEINEDMVQILLMLEVLFTQDSKVEDLFCGASSGSEPRVSVVFLNNYDNCVLQRIFRLVGKLHEPKEQLAAVNRRLYRKSDILCEYTVS